MSELKFKVMSNIMNRETLNKVVPVSCSRYSYRDTPWIEVFTGNKKQCQKFLTRKKKST